VPLMVWYTIVSGWYLVSMLIKGFRQSVTGGGCTKAGIRSQFKQTGHVLHSQAPEVRPLFPVDAIVGSAIFVTDINLKARCMCMCV
jgi:hypothetical protein